MSLGRRGYDVVLAEAGGHLGGRVAREARLPGLATWIRVVDYREGQLRLANVELAFNSELTAEEIVSYGFDHVAIATGARWRRDGTGRGHATPVDLGDLPLLTPDDLMDGVRPDGERVVIYDDDHYYMGGVLAELLVREGRRVTLVTPSARVSEWTVNTMEQDRIQRRLLGLDVEIRTTHTVAGGGAERCCWRCTYTEREHAVGCDALVLVTRATPRDGLVAELQRAEVGGGPFAPSATRGARPRSPPPCGTVTATPSSSTRRRRPTTRHRSTAKWSGSPRSVS